MTRDIAAVRAAARLGNGEWGGVAGPKIDDVERAAIFLDLDGTLADIAETPSAVRIAPDLLETLEALRSRVGGALAIISGRDIEDIDQLVAPHRFAAAGVHGARRRAADGKHYGNGLSATEVERFAEAFRRELSAEGGLLIEIKAAAFALHYRLRPDLKERCAAFVRRQTDHEPGLRVLAGKAVYEIVSRDTSKGAAIRAFMNEAPFAGRVPIFAGDDITDEAGFTVVNEMRGVSIKIGEGPTLAEHRLSGADEFRHWLSSLAVTSNRDSES